MKLKEKMKKITQKKTAVNNYTKKRLEKLSEKINTSWKSKKTALELLKEERN